MPSYLDQSDRPTQMAAQTGEVEWSDRVTDYDRAHLLVYAQLLDAVATGQSETDMIAAILKLAPDAADSRTKLARHLARARWMRETGYAQILSGEAQLYFRS